jgi:hypothetical protein
MTRPYSLLLFIILAVISCQSIESGRSLDKKTIARIKELGLLDSNESIILYYSNNARDNAGNFFTDRRIAHYWLDQHDDSKTDISFAYYQDIISIDTNFIVYDFDIPYMTIRKKDSTTFKVYVDGSLKQEKAFFETAIDQWRKKK